MKSQLENLQSPGPDINELIEKRSKDVVRARAEAETAWVKEFFDKHQDLRRDPAYIAFDTIIERERREAITDLTLMREAGELNDKRSITPGITVYVAQVPWEIPRVVAKVNYAEKYSDRIKEIGGTIEDLDNGLMKVKLPNGIFIDLSPDSEYQPRSLYVYQQSFYEGQILYPNRQTPDELLSEYAIRIEGDAGELWQNRDYTPEGNPRPQTA